MKEGRRWHFIGIGGIGMSGLARILLEREESVSGSDLKSTALVQELINAGASVSVGQAAENIRQGMSVVYSTAVKDDNPELCAAREQSCELLHRSELLAQLTQGYRCLAVTGTHGKTTTSALLSHVLLVADLDPTFAVGGVLQGLGCNARMGHGQDFVVEADESDGSFLNYLPYAAIVTNLEPEHMDYYGSEEALTGAFKQFFQGLSNPDLCFWNGDDPRLKALGIEGTSYGFGAQCSWRAELLTHDSWTSYFTIHGEAKRYEKVELALAGEHNVSNALAVFALALRLGIPEEALREAFRTFKGIKRRCQRIAESHDILILDDYAHHPTEIRATLRAIRQAAGPRRVIAVYQPHRYSRTKDCQGMYQYVFDEADQVVLTDIFAAGEKPIPGVSHESILHEIQQSSWPPSRYASRDTLVDTLSDIVRPHDVLVTMGAGDVHHVAQELAEEVEKSLPDKLRVALIFGGRSLEHDISIASARHIAQLLESDDVEVKEFGVTRDGEWIHGVDVVDFLSVHEEMLGEKPRRSVVSAEVISQLMQCDVVFPVLHGPFGEDGMIQGFVETLGLPYVGSDYRAAALCTDKAFVKRIMMAGRIPTAPFVSFSYTEWQRESNDLLARIGDQLVFPLYVKSGHYGSSIGVYRVDRGDELPHYIEESLRFDTHVLVEEGVRGRELEFAVMGNDWLHVPPPAEIFTDGQVYDFNAKYRRGSIEVKVQAELDPEYIEEGQRFAARAFRTAGCCGMGTVSAFLDEEGQFWFNEIDPTPGFTNVSLFTRIWEANGLEPKQLVSQLLVLAMHRRSWQEKVFGRTMGRNKPRYDEQV